MRNMGHAARQNFEQKYSANINYGKLMDLYELVM